MMKSAILFVTLILTTSSIAYSQRQASTDTCKSRSFTCEQQRKILTKFANGDECCSQVKRLKKDSTTLQYILGRSELQVGELKFQIDLATVAINELQQKINQVNQQLSDQQKKTELVEKQRDRQKRLKWVFGGLGLILGACLIFL